VIVALLLLTAVVTFAAGYAVATLRASRKASARMARGASSAPAALRPLRDLPPHDPSPAAAPSAPSPRVEPAQVEPAQPEPWRVEYDPDAAEGTPAWRATMGALGDRMRAAGVRVVVFVHGSFVGDDPLNIARMIEDAVPILPDLARKLRGLTRGHLSRLLGDLSNFTGDYIEAFARATGVDAIEFTWSGENHHTARVQGAVRLARALALHRGSALEPGDGVLLVGHSHGGQLFAVLSQLVARVHGFEELVAAAQARGEDVGALETHLALLRRCRIDVATFGTPDRYAWARGARFRLLHVVNHRGPVASSRSEALRGVLRTTHGDYVRRVGVHGSDFPSPSAQERAMNARLDRVLGRGTSLRTWFRAIERGLRISTEGRTVLVDYGDEAAALPNFLATGLGHAAYTRREAMLFHARLLADHFYPALPVRPWAQRVRGWLGPRRILPLSPREPSTPDG
jgi:hypothetical protein